MTEQASFRWGIMGTGGIAGSMAGALRDRGAAITAVGSARPGAARSFAEAWGIPHALDSHEAVARHPDVDIVYVATTNDRHLDNALAAIDAGVPVLCEKPLAMGAEEAGRMVDAARSADVFLMEGMWMRFNPHIAAVDRLIADGAIGTPNLVEASLSFFTSDAPERRWRSPELGGGTVVDLTIYPMSLAHHVLGPPTSTAAMARLSDTGVDVASIVVASHADGALSSSIASFDSDTANTAVVSGSEGRIVLDAPMHSSHRITLERRRERVEDVDTGFEGHGFRFESAHVEDCVRQGLTESPLRPHRHTLEVMDWMDEVRALIGVRFPTDAQPKEAP